MMLEPGQIVIVNAPKSSWHRKKAVVHCYHPDKNTATVHRFGSSKRTFSTRNLVEEYSDGGKAFARGAGKPQVKKPKATPVNLDDVSINDNRSMFSDSEDDLFGSDVERDFEEEARWKKRNEEYRKDTTNPDGSKKDTWDFVQEVRFLRQEIQRLQLSLEAMTNQLISDVNERLILSRRGPLYN
jgi:hypothetical protein